MAHQHATESDDGATIAWSRMGVDDPREPVVLVHGITECAAAFDPIVERLARSDAVITLDLRGHGESSPADRYDLDAMAGDVLTVCRAAGAARPRLVGHSLGGAVVTAAGARTDVHSVVDVDQSLQLGAFKDLLDGAADALADPVAYQSVVDTMFDSMIGEQLSDEERQRIASLRRSEHDVVLGVWDVILSHPVGHVEATVDAALAPYREHPVPYLALFGIDPGQGYASWLADRVPGAEVETWGGHGHYPHLVDTDRFVDRLARFWADAAD